MGRGRREGRCAESRGRSLLLRGGAKTAVVRAGLKGTRLRGVGTAGSEGSGLPRERSRVGRGLAAAGRDEGPR